MTYLTLNGRHDGRNGPTDNQERKLRDFAKLARKFKAASDRLVNAGVRKAKWPAGTPSWQKAEEHYEAADKQYDELAVLLEELIQEYL